MMWLRAKMITALARLSWVRLNRVQFSVAAGAVVVSKQVNREQQFAHWVGRAGVGYSLVGRGEKESTAEMVFEDETTNSDHNPPDVIGMLPLGKWLGPDCWWFEQTRHKRGERGLMRRASVRVA